MKLGLPLSFIFHALGIFGSFFVFSGALDAADEVRIIPVEIVSLGEQTNIRAVKKAPQEENIKEVDEPMRVETPTPESLDEGEPERDANTLSKPAAPDIQPSEAEETLAAVDTTLDSQDLTETDAKKVVEAPKAPSFDLDRMSALIDQTRASRPDTNQGQALQSESTQYAFAKTARDGAGLQTELTMSEVDALRARMYKCWRVSADARNAEEIIVRVRVQLFPDGSVKDVDLLERAKINSSRDPYVQIAAERALRAVSKCAPYDFLPQDKYSSWQDMELSFRPDL